MDWYNRDFAPAWSKLRTEPTVVASKTYFFYVYIISNPFDARWKTSLQNESRNDKIQRRSTKCLNKT